MSPIATSAVPCRVCMRELRKEPQHLRVVTRWSYALGVCLCGLALGCGSGVAEQGSDAGVEDTGDEALPYCVNQGGGSEYAVHEDEVDELVLLDEAGEILEEAPTSVRVGEACEVPGLLGQCRIGEVQCASSGLRCEQVHVPTVEAAGFDGIDHSCDGFDRYLDAEGAPHVIYVQAGDDSPSLGEAIALAAECDLAIDGQQIPCDVFVEGSNLLISEETVTLIEGVHVYGRFDRDRWDPTEGEFSAPSYESSAGNSRVRVESALGLLAQGLQATTPIYGLTIETHDRIEEPGCGPNIGALVGSAPGLQLKQVEIVSGRAPRGVDGAEGETPASGQMGNYFDGDAASSIAVGGLGGNHGGDSGSGECYYMGVPIVINSGHFGQDGAPFTPHGGSGGAPHCDRLTTGYSEGSPGAGGVAAEAAPLAPLLSLQFTGDPIDYRCEIAEVVVSETAHGGGGGGSGLVYRERIPAIQFEKNRAFLRVGGGGGGWAGGAGGGGQSGGASIGMILIDTEELDFEALTLQAGRGGEGGAGGAAGDGSAGAPSQTISWLGSGATGGWAGDGAGGTGGNGGHGGASISLLSINSSVSAGLALELQAMGGGAGGQGGAAGSRPEVHVYAPEGVEAEPGNDGHHGLDGFVCHHYQVTTGGDPVSEHELDPGNCLD